VGIRWLVVGGWQAVCDGADRAALPPPEKRPATRHQSPITNHQPPTTLRRLLSRRVGEGAERPGLARCFVCFTVSTKQAAPRSRFPRALRLAALISSLAGSPPQTLLAATRGGQDLRQRPAHSARGEQAEAIHRPPRGPPRYPSPGLHRSTTARRHRGAGSDALPTDGMGELWGRSQRGWLMTLHFLKGEGSQGVGAAGYADNRRIVSTRIPSPIGRRWRVAPDVGRLYPSAQAAAPCRDTACADCRHPTHTLSRKNDRFALVRSSPLPQGEGFYSVRRISSSARSAVR